MNILLERLERALAGRYGVERELGRGGMATVYLARDLRHGREVAIKLLLPELASAIGAERFLQEIRTTATLQHPHILPLFDSGEADGLLYYVMPRVEGESLRTRLDREPFLPIEEVQRLIGRIAAALDYAHRRGVVHRDIKPENILLHQDEPLVADFGIALAASEAGERLTSTGLSIGTPEYMSPEQASGERVLDARTDVYALGVLAYEMLAGEPPFTGPTAQAVVARALVERPRPIRTVRDAVPEGMEGAVLRALAKLPVDRYASAGAFAAALSAPRPEPEIPSAGIEADARPWGRPTGGARRVARLGAVALLGVGVVALAAVVLTTLWPGRAPPRVTGRRQITFVGNVEHVGLSPDGRFLAYGARNEDSLMVHVQDLAGGTPIRLTAFRGILFNLEWSPDGTRILAIGTAVTPNPTAFAHLLAPLGGDVRPLPLGTYIAQEQANGTWLPDGERVALWGEAAQPRARALVLHLRSGDTTWIPLPPIENGMFGNGAWSPKAGLLAIYAERAEAPVGDLVVVTPDGQVRRVGEDAVAPLASPRWLPSGDAVLALGAGDQLMHIAVNPRDGTPRRRSSSLSSGLEAWSWGGDVRYTTFSLSRDGGRAVYTRSVRHTNLTLLDARAPGPPRPVTTSTSLKGLAVVSPDGRRAAFVQPTAAAGNGDLWVVSLVDGREPPRRVTFSEAARWNGDNPTVAWSPDGARLAFVHASMRLATIAVDGDGQPSIYRDIPADPVAGLSWAPASRIANALGRTIGLVEPETGRNTILWEDSTLGFSFPVWAPDGRRLALQVRDDVGGRGGFWLLDPGEAPRQVLAEAGKPLGWTDDGSAIYVQLEGTHEISTVTLNGRRRTFFRAPSTPGWCRPIGRSAPGRFLCTTPVTISDAWLLELEDP